MVTPKARGRQCLQNRIGTFPGLRLLSKMREVFNFSYKLADSNAWKDRFQSKNWCHNLSPDVRHVVEWSPNMSNRVVQDEVSVEKK